MLGYVLSLSLTAWCQTQQASLRGSVEGASGASIPGAILTLTNVGQNRSWEAKANDDGVYAFLQIPPGNYRLSVEAAGFKKHTRAGLRLEVAMVAEINVAMEVGQVTCPTPCSGMATSNMSCPTAC